MILKSLKYKDFDFDQIDTSKVKYTRIEIGISINIIREKISGFLRRNYCKNERIKSIQNSFNKSFWEFMFLSDNVSDYMLKNGLNEYQINDFLTFAKEVNENIKINDKFSELGEQQQRAVKIYIMTLKYNIIYVETGGMYLSIIMLTYKILKSFIENGGICIEIAYPHFDVNDDLGLYISSNPKIIKLGEMKIKST